MLIELDALAALFDQGRPSDLSRTAAEPLLRAIDALLRDDDLQFPGFLLDPHVLHAYRLRFPGDRAATNLGHRHDFEIENPDTFRSMYQFWIAKAGHR